MNKAIATLSGLGLGAGLMYFFDPDRGRRRRALVRDQAVGALNRMDELVDEAGVDLRNRARGALAEARAVFSREQPPDWVLAERARAAIGWVVRSPSSIKVWATQGRLTLSGPVLQSELEPLLSRVASVRGVKQVDNQLEVHASPEGVPGLQSSRQRRERRAELMQEHWAPSTRLLAGAGGGLLGVYGLRQGGLPGLVLGALGAGLAMRAATNLPARRLFGVGGGRRAVEVQKTININAPVERVYALWSDFTNFPRFMAHVREVRDLGDGRSHWKVAGPAGAAVEWDAILTKHVHNQLLGWRSVEGEAVKSAGLVRFEPNPDGSTRVTVRLAYNPPAGALGHAVASLFGADPLQAMHADLLRLKSLLEEGQTTAKGHEVYRRDLTAA